MLDEQNTQQEQLTDFLHDARWWKQTLAAVETETQFIGQLLKARIYRENIPNLFERLQKYKLEMESRSGETKNLKKEIAQYEEKLQGLLKSGDTFVNTDYQENHIALKGRYEEYYNGLNDYKTRVFNYLGSML